MAEGQGAIRSLLAIFDVGFDNKSLKRGNAAVNEATKGVEALGKKIVAFLAVRQVVELAEAFVGLAVSIGVVSDNLDVSVQSLQKWEFFAQQVEISAGTITSTMVSLTDQLLAASIGAEDSLMTFGHLGVGLRNNNGQFKKADELIESVGFKLAGMKNEAFQASIGQKLLGSKWRETIRLFDKGEEGLAELRKRFAELGGGMSPEFIERSREASLELGQLKFAFQSLFTSILSKVLPIVTIAVQNFKRLIVSIRKVVHESRLFQAALIVVSTILAVKAVKAAGLFTVALVKMILPLVPMILAFTALALVVEDFLAFLEGGPSVVGKFLESLFGKKQVDTIRDRINSIIDTIKKIFVALFSDTEEAGEAWDSLMDQMAEGSSDTLEELGTTFEEFFFFLRKDISRWTSDVVDDFATAWKMAGKDLDKFGHKIGRSFKKWAEAPRNFSRFVSKTFDDLVDTLVSRPLAELDREFSQLFDELSATFFDNVEEIKFVIMQLADVVLEPFERIFGTLTDKVGGFIDGLFSKAAGFFRLTESDEDRDKRREDLEAELKVFDNLIRMQQRSSQSVGNTTSVDNSRSNFHRENKTEINVTVNAKTNASAANIGRHTAREVRRVQPAGNDAMIDALTPGTSR